MFCSISRLLCWNFRCAAQHVAHGRGMGAQCVCANVAPSRRRAEHLQQAHWWAPHVAPLRPPMSGMEVDAEGGKRGRGKGRGRGGRRRRGGKGQTDWLPARPQLPAWPPWIERTRQVLDQAQTFLPQGVAVSRAGLSHHGLGPPGPDERWQSERVQQHFLYRRSAEGVRATTFAPSRHTMLIHGRPCQVFAASAQLGCLFVACFSLLPLGPTPHHHWRVNAPLEHPRRFE